MVKEFCPVCALGHVLLDPDVIVKKSWTTVAKKLMTGTGFRILGRDASKS